MGNLTTIVLHLDALHSFKKNPEEFGQAILDGIDKANDARKQVDMGFKSYGNYISVEPSRHADDETVFVHTGNTVFNLNPWNKDFQDLAAQNKSVLEKFIKRAQRIITCARQELKKIKQP